MDTVDKVLRDHPNVRAVATFTTSGREPALRVAAVVPDPVNAAADLRDHVAETVEPSALPDLLLAVPDLPHGADGTVDTARIERDLLDVPGAGFSFRAPATATEVELAAIWSEVLGRPRVFAGDNFLDLGGDSMTAVLLLDLITERLGVDLPLDDLLAAPSLSALAEGVDAAR